MVDCLDDRSDVRLSCHAIYDVMLTLQSAAVNNHVTGVNTADSDRVWSLSSGEMLCCYHFTVIDDDNIRSPGCTDHHHNTGRQRTAIQCMCQSKNHVYQLGLWRRARPQPDRFDGQLYGHTELSADHCCIRSTADYTCCVDRLETA